MTGVSVINGFISSTHTTPWLLDIVMMVYYELLFENSFPGINKLNEVGRVKTKTLSFCKVFKLSMKIVYTTYTEQLLTIHTISSGVLKSW